MWTIAATLLPDIGQCWTAEVKATQDCVALQYGIAKKSPYLDHVGSHHSEFQLRCDVTGPPPGATVAYQWSPVYVANPNPPVGSPYR